jgi:hypothetical protein
MFVTRVLGFVHSGFGFPLAGGSGKSSSLVYETSNPRDKHVGELFLVIRYEECGSGKKVRSAGALTV